MPSDKLKFFSEEEYFRFEEKSEIKYEYVDRQIYAMSGATQRHNEIQMNIFLALSKFLCNRPCRAFIGNHRVKIKKANCYYYPDVMVTCSGLDDGKSVYNEGPVLVVEVLSRSTAPIDRREKLSNYLKLESLREYVLVQQNRKKVELYRLDNDGSWTKTDYGPGDFVIFKSLPAGEFKLSVEEIYRDVNIDPDLQVKEDSPEYSLSENELYDLCW